MTSFAADTAARVCNTPTTEASLQLDMPPDIPSVHLSPANSTSAHRPAADAADAGNAHLNCSCTAERCCDNALGDGRLDVRLRYLFDNNVKDMRYSVCEAALPAVFDGPACSPPGDVAFLCAIFTLNGARRHSASRYCTTAQAVAVQQEQQEQHVGSSVRS